MNKKSVFSTPVFRKIAIILLILIYIACQAGHILAKQITMNASIGAVSLSGVLTAVQMLCAGGMVVISYDIGAKIAFVLLSLSMLTVFRVVIVTKQYESVPGLLFTIASFLVVAIMSRSLKKTDLLSKTDYLVGIGNRRYTMQHIDEWIRRKKPFYLLYMDLDHFKYINDTKGHEQGDLILKYVVEKWKAICKRDFFLGRIGGDEFVYVIPAKTGVDINSIVKDLLLFDTNSPVNQGNVYVTTSIGIVRYPEDANDSRELFKKADAALYNAKQNGRNKCCYYDSSIDNEVSRKEEIEAIIKDALEHDKFYLMYQPQYYAEDKRIRGVEALLRIRGDEEKGLEPLDIISVAEESHLIVQVGKFVIRRALTDLVDAVRRNSGFILSVNVSAKQILDSDFLFDLKENLAMSGFPPKNLELEITEYCVMDAAEDIIKKIEKIRAMGVRFAMDDFGTGYSSVTYLARLPIEMVKIDRCLVESMGQRELMTAIVSMSHVLGCDVIAEGVESEEQLEELKKIGCDFTQGFCWSRPVLAEEICSMIRK